MPTIAHFIPLVRQALAQIQRGRLPRLPQIETDFSWATLQAACMGANNMDISQYLECIYHENSRAVTPIHICPAHVIHCAAWKCAKQIRQKLKKEKMVRLFFPTHSPNITM